MPSSQPVILIYSQIQFSASKTYRFCASRHWLTASWSWTGWKHGRQQSIYALPTPLGGQIITLNRGTKKETDRQQEIDRLQTSASVLFQRQTPNKRINQKYHKTQRNIWVHPEVTNQVSWFEAQGLSLGSWSSQWFRWPGLEILKNKDIITWGSCRNGRDFEWEKSRNKKGAWTIDDWSNE